MAKPKKKRQHYVPRLYLRFFADDQEKIHAFNVQNGSKFHSSIDNVAQESYFYDLPAHLAKQFHYDPQMQENALSRFEDRFTHELTAFIAGNTAAIATVENRTLISQHIIIQALRTRRMRDYTVETMEPTYRQACQTVTEDEFAAILIGTSLFDRDEMFPMVKNLFGRKWILGVTRNTLPFYTSDAPVIFNPIQPGEDVVSSTSPPVDVVFPLTPTQILILTDRRRGEKLSEGWDNSRWELTEKSIVHLNQMQCANCHTFVYGSTPDFSVAETFRASQSA